MKLIHFDGYSGRKLPPTLLFLALLLLSKSGESFEITGNSTWDEQTSLVQNTSASVVNETRLNLKIPTSGKLGRRSLAPVFKEVLENYDDTTWPTYGTNEPTLVDVNVHILRMGSFDASRMEYTMDIYLRQSWSDPRLRLSEYGVKTEISVTGEKYLQHLWKPDVFFLNAKSANFHVVTVPNILLKITPKGHILTGLRLSLRLSCPMQFHRYPLDTQNCSITFGPFAQPMDQMVLRWRKENPLTTEELLQPEFEIVSKKPIHFVRQMNITGNFSFLKVEFILARRSGYHLVQTYLPTFLIVTISWVSFWLNADATPARVTLGVTTLLALTTVASGVRTKLPPVSYVKAIDVWIGTCSIMVFGALLEFTLVNYLSRKKAEPKSSSQDMMSRSDSSKLKPEESLVTVKNSGKTGEQAPADIESSLKAEATRRYIHNRAKRVDQASRFIFPFVFLVFNLTYWTYYLYVPN